MYGFLNCGNNTDGGVEMKDKLIQFFKRNGFLLILFIAVCFVAASTIYIATKDLKTVNEPRLEDLIIVDENVEKPTDTAMLEDGKNDIKDEDKSQAVEANADKQQNSDMSDSLELETKDVDVDVVANTIKKLEFVDEEDQEEDQDINIVSKKADKSILPVDGQIITEFSNDTLIYSTTLEEWRSHNGIDIKAAVGTKIKAPLDGTIKEVYEDELWGIVIIISHGDGLESKLANLGTKEMVKVGVKVNKGDLISTIGNTAGIEMALDSHLHYELTKNGKMIDPRSIN